MGRSGRKPHIRGRARRGAVAVDIAFGGGDVGGDVRREVPRCLQLRAHDQ
jgi:hypothetical protein